MRVMLAIIDTVSRGGPPAAIISTATVAALSLPDGCVATRVACDDHGFFIEAVQDVDLIFRDRFIVTAFLTMWLLKAQLFLAAATLQ